MALVGTIKPGTVSTVLESVTHAKTDLTVVFEQPQHFGRVKIEGGVVTEAEADTLEGDEALEALAGWETGIYTLIEKRVASATAETHAHVALVGLPSAPGTELRQRLETTGHDVTIMPYDDDTLGLLKHLSPDLLVMACPLIATGTDCQDFVFALAGSKNPPVLLCLRCADAPDCDADYDLCFEKIDVVCDQIGGLRKQLQRRRRPTFASAVVLGDSDL